MNVLVLLISHAFIQGILLIGLLIWNKRINKISKLFLSLFLINSTLILGNYLFERFHWYKVYPDLIWLTASIWFLVGPFIYWFISSICKTNWRFDFKQLLHLIPFLTGIYYVFPFYMLEESIKLQFFINYYNNDSFTLDYFSVFNQLSIFLYSLISISILHINRPENINPSGKAVYKYLKIFLLLNILFSCISQLYTFMLPGNQDLLLKFSDLLIVLFALPIQTIAIYFLINRNCNLILHNEKIRIFNFQPLLEKQLLDIFENDKIYLKPDLKVVDLSNLSGIPGYEISKFISIKYKLNFHDFVNHYRVEEAKKQLISQSNHHLTLEAIGLECGFNSRSSFFRVFKKISGITPNEYKSINQS